MPIERRLPDGYDEKTECCIRCAKMIDRSHPDGYELYCGADGVQEPPLPRNDELANPEEYDRKSNAWWNWSVPRSVQPWATCPLFELSKSRVEEENRLDEQEAEWDKADSEAQKEAS